MSVLRLWPLLAFMFVPGVFAWWSGRRLVRERDDPTLAERFLARAEHAQRVTLLSAACLAFAAGSYYWFAVLGLVLGHWIGDYPSRRVVLDERWAPATYVLWHLRFHLAWLGFWFALLVAPTVIQASGVWRWPVAGTLAVLLGLWAWRYTEAFVWLVRARPRPWRTEWQPIVDRARATRPRLFDMPVPGGRFVNAFAFPSTRVPSVLFTDPALELLSAREQAAVFAHEVAHLEHYDRRRCRIVSAITYGLVATATLGAALALDRLPAELFMPFWSLGLITGFLWKTSRHKAHETESDVRALALCDDPQALISGLTKLAIAGRMPRRWSSELEHGSSHPSLARRLHAIRRAAPIPVMPFDDTLVVATTRPTSLVVLDRDGVWWVEARDPAERDPETLRQTARSRWSVPYDELVELRVRVFWWGGGASLVARDRSGASRAVQIAPTEVEALQRKLDAVEHRLAHDTLVPEPPAAVGRFTAMALGFVVVFVAGLLSLGLITGLVAIIRPSRAALAAVAGVAGACLLVFAGDLGVRSPTWPTLAYAAAAGLVCAMAVWLARQPRTFDGRPAGYLPTMGALVLVVALTGGPLVAHLVRTRRRPALAAHLLGGAPILWAALFALAAALLTTPRRGVRRSGAVLLAAAALVGPGVKLVDTLLTSRPTIVGETGHGTLPRTAQLELPWRVGVLRVSPVGTRAAVMTREAARAPDRFLVLRLEGGRADLEGRDLRFIDERNALTLVESATHMRLQHLELAEASASADWSIVLPPPSSVSATSTSARSSGDSGWRRVRRVRSRCGTSPGAPASAPTAASSRSGAKRPSCWSTSIEPRRRDGRCRRTPAYPRISSRWGIALLRSSAARARLPSSRSSTRAGNRWWYTRRPDKEVRCDEDPLRRRRRDRQLPRRVPHARRAGRDARRSVGRAGRDGPRERHLGHRAARPVRGAAGDLPPARGAADAARLRRRLRGDEGLRHGVGSPARRPSSGARGVRGAGRELLAGGDR